MTEEDLGQFKEKAESYLHQLSKTVLEGLRPAPGPYAFFHHSAHALERLNDCHRVVARLFEQRRLLTKLGIEFAKKEPKDWPPGIPYPKEVQNIMRAEEKFTAYMKLDLETLYIFGEILLDQWSLQAVMVANLGLPRKYPFTELVIFFDSGKKSLLDPIWETLKGKMLWLYYNLRFYRNRFIVHGNRPWQRGTTRLVYGDDFNLHTPTPPGWLDDEKIDNEIRKLVHLAPEHIQKAPDDYWEKARPGRLIEMIFYNIGNISDRRDREKVAALFGQKGGSAPTFQVIARNLFELVGEGTEILNEIAKENLSTLDLGKPFKHGN